MKKLLVLLLLCSSCAVPSYTVTGNARVFDRMTDTRMTKRQADKLFHEAFTMRAWIDVLPSHQKSVHNHTNWELQQELLTFFTELFEGWDFVFTSAWLGQQTEAGFAVADGKTVMKEKVIFLKVRNCYADNALLHEMAHVIRVHYGVDEDRNEHKDIGFWFAIDKLMSKQLTKKLCPEGYKRNDKLPTEVVIVN